MDSLTINRKHPQSNTSFPRIQRAGLLPALILCGAALVFGLPKAAGELVLPELPKKKKKDKSEVELPPQAVPVEVQITPGGEVVIPLKVYGWRGRNVRYLLRSQPKAGKFQIVEGRDGVWALHYQHNGAIPPESGAVDRFFYAAQDYIATSAPAEIAVKVVDFPPQFEIPQALTFHELYTGDTQKQTLTIANRGGGTLVGRLFADAPWKLSAEAYQLKRGEEKTITITFAPESEQAYRGRITVAGHPELEITLTGAARDAFRVTPMELDLMPTPGGVERSGTWQLENRSPEARTISITADARLGLPETVTLPAGETVSLSARLREDDLLRFSGSITFANGHLRHTVKVAAAPIGARLTAEALDFGTISTSQEVEKSVAVSNCGGSIAQITVTAPPGITVEPMRFDLEPGSEANLKVTLRSGEPGDYQSALRLQTSGEVSFDLPLTARIEAAPASDTSQLALSDRPGLSGSPSSAPLAKPANTSLRDRLAQLRPKKGDPSVPIVKEVKAHRLGRQTVEITWEAPEGAQNVSYQLESRRIYRDSFGQLAVTWQPLKDTVIHRNGSRLSAVLTGPDNGMSGEVQVITISSNGKPSTPSHSVSYTTPISRPIVTTQRLLLGFFLLLGAAALWLKLRSSHSWTAGLFSRFRADKTTS